MPVLHKSTVTFLNQLAEFGLRSVILHTCCSQERIRIRISLTGYVLCLFSGIREPLVIRLRIHIRQT